MRFTAFSNTGLTQFTNMISGISWFVVAALIGAIALMFILWIIKGMIGRY